MLKISVMTTHVGWEDEINILYRTLSEQKVKTEKAKKLLYITDRNSKYRQSSLQVV